MPNKRDFVWEVKQKNKQNRLLQTGENFGLLHSKQKNKQTEVIKPEEWLIFDYIFKMAKYWWLRCLW